MAVRLFEEADHVATYAKFRPTYPNVVYEAILKYYEAGKGPTCNYGLAVDLGCGNGQSTRPLTNYFKQVIGSDVSPGQIANAKTDGISNLTFKVGAGEDLSFQDNNSVDLVTIALAFQYVDREAFFKEVTRVLKPGGVLAIFGYGRELLDNVEGQKLVDEYYDGLLGPYWEACNIDVFNMHREVSLPFPGWKRLDGEVENIPMSLDVDEFVNYLSTFSAWRTLLKSSPGSDYLSTMKQRLTELYPDKQGAKKPVVNFGLPVFLIVGRKPT